MRMRKLPSLAAAALLGAAIAMPVLSHPVFAPYDNTQFAPIEEFGPVLGLETIATGLLSPVKAVVAPGEPNNLYAVDQTGQIWKIDLKNKDLKTNKTKILDVGKTGLNLLVVIGALGPDTFDERGLLGLAFHPNYANNKKFYTYTSEPASGAATFTRSWTTSQSPDHQNVVSEWTSGSNTRRVLLKVDWPQFNHDGGDLAFGPDGYLYISMGDGGGADDRDTTTALFPYPVTTPAHAAEFRPIFGHGLDGNGQKLSVPLGKILRIDVNSKATGKEYGIPNDNPFVGRAGALAEIYAYGLRNPYRMSFDMRTGKLYAGDVGQNDIEEVNVIVKGGNYGWPIKEGTLFFNHNGELDGTVSVNPPLGAIVPSNLIDPIAQYDNHHEGHSVIGGFVYRGKAIKEMWGQYIFADYSTLFNLPSGPHDYGRVFHINPRGHHDGPRTISEIMFVPSGRANLAMLGSGQDHDGEVYMTGNRRGIPFPAAGDPPVPGGVVLKLVPYKPRGHSHDNNHDDDHDSK